MSHCSRNLVVLALSLLAASHAASAQDTSLTATLATIPQRSVLQVQLRDTTLRGWLHGATRDSLFLRDRFRYTHRLGADEIATIDIGERRLGRRVANGALIGTLVGLAGAGVIVNDTEECLGCELVVAASPFVGAAGGAILGLMVGTSTVGAWRRLYPRQH